MQLFPLADYFLDSFYVKCKALFAEQIDFFLSVAMRSAHVSSKKFKIEGRFFFVFCETAKNDHK